jgi:PTH1 family peptidyl-tRNA hydrolase
VGLGNPETRYDRTRHNVGYLVIDELAARWGVACDREKYEARIAEARHGQEKILLLKPLTYMNLSGRSVAKAARNNLDEPEQLVIITDDTYLPLGRLRLRKGGSAGGHNGMQSIIESVGTKEFIRLRMGIGSQAAGQPLEAHVLSKFRPEERPVVDDMVSLAADAVEAFLDKGLEQAMNEYNRDTRPT